MNKYKVVKYVYADTMNDVLDIENGVVVTVDLQDEEKSETMGFIQMKNNDYTKQGKR